MANKNVRLTFEAWNALRNLKFKEQLPTYSHVFENLFNESSGVEMSDHSMKSKTPNDADNQFKNKDDKTIVINLNMHNKLTQFKIDYMQKTGATSRGKGAVSISDVVLTLIKNYELTRGG